MNLKFLKNTWSIARRYFIASEHKTAALAYFFAVIAIIILMVGFNYALSLSLAAFWASLTTLNIHVFFSSLLVTSAYMFINSMLSVLRNYLTEMLITNWRSFLTLNLINKYLNPEKQAYLFFSRDQEMHNVGQNIQVDTQKFTDKALNLGFDFFGSVLSIITFMYSLWHIGGNLSLIVLGVHLFIPGYLVIASLLLGLLANFIAYQIGKRLSTLINNRLIEEAKFRTEIEKIHESAEYIAQAKSSKYHQTILSSIFANAQTYSFSMLYEKIKLNSFQSFFSNFSKLFPYLLASPLYFVGKLSISALNQTAYAFTELSRSMAWFQTAIKDIAELSAASERLKNLYDHLDVLTQQRIIHKQDKDKNQIDFILTQVTKPKGEVLFKNLKLTLQAGEHVLIQGPSGLGKSSLFKSLAGNWPYADGKILIPDNRSLMFLPQKPYIPADDFKTVLSYPDEPSAHLHQSYVNVLRDVGLDSFIPSLDTKGEWASSLSGGQQQRVLFARALLKKPDWLFMDESSSSLDEASEERLYNTLIQTLRDTTIVSIAHKETVAKFHDKIIKLLIDAHTNEVAVDVVKENVLKQSAA